MSTLHVLRRAVYRLAVNHIAKAKTRRFLLGVSCFSLHGFVTLNAAGRSLGINRWTGENRVRRTVADAGLADRLQQLLVTEAFAGRKGYWYCSLDHSQFGPFCIAVLAVSNRAGRAIPVWCQVNVSEAALMLPLVTALKGLLAYLRTIAPGLKLVLVMDRWFAADKLFTLLETYGIYFIARTKSDKRICAPWDQYWQRSPIGEVSPLETAVTYRKHHLRLIRSVLKPGVKEPEPWFLFTNLPAAITRRCVLNRYAERFEVEEAFKDLKWLQGLEWQRIRKPEVIRSLLLFVFLGWLLLWRYAVRVLPKQRTPGKKQLSWFRQAWEHLQQLLRVPLLPVPPLQGREKK